MRKLILIFFFFAVGCLTLPAQKPLAERSWSSVATGMPDDWYGSDESVRVAENVLLYQRNLGGWPKNTPFHLPL